MQPINKLDVSVIIPTYNRVQFLAKTINSILHQTIPAKEVILVDDGSNDNTADLAREYGKDVIYVYQKNQGVSAARNLGISLATSKYITFLDSDDYWDPKKLEKQVTAMEEHPDAVAHICNISWYKGKDIRPQSFWVNSNAQRAENEEGALNNPLAWVIKDSVAVVPSIMVRSDVLKIAGGFNTALSLWEDTDFAARVALCGPWVFSTDPFVFIRELSDEEDRLSRVRSVDNCYSQYIKCDILSALLSNPNLIQESHRKMVVSEIAKSTYGLAGAKARTGAIAEAGKLYLESFKLGLRCKSALMLLALYGSRGTIHRLLR